MESRVISSAEAHTLDNEKTELEGLRGVLEDTVSHVGRYYAQTYCFSVRFEADDTSAFHDTAYF